MKRKNIIILIISLGFMISILGFTFKNNLEAYFNNTTLQNNNENTENDSEDINDDVIENEEKNSEEVTNEEKNNEETTTEEEKMKAPNFTLKNMKGKEVSLSDYKGKVVFLNFWATWCPYCVKEMPDLQKLYKENIEDFVVLAIDVEESKSTVEDYLKDKDYTFPILLDEQGLVASTYYISSFPTTYVIDKEGYLLGGVPGMMTYPQMSQILESVKESK